MHTLIISSFRSFLRSILFALAFPLLAHAALPQSASVPGGVAVIPLGEVAAGAGMPMSWLEGQPVLVTADQGQWYAVVGLGLNTKPGSHELLVKTGSETKTLSFEVGTKDYPEQHVTIKDNGKVELSPENQTRAASEIAVIKNLKHFWRDAQDVDLAFIIPAEGRLSSRFGLRRFFNGKPRNPHAGLDVAVGTGTPVMASAQAKVLAVDDYFFNGKTVFLDHGNGLITMYCHLDRIDVQPGETVGKGQPIGLSGMTGRASGPHLHWSVVLNGEMVDPALFVPENAADAIREEKPEDVPGEGMQPGL